MAFARAAASARQLPMVHLAPKSESPIPGRSMAIIQTFILSVGPSLTNGPTSRPGARGAVKVEWQLAVGWPALIVAEPAALGQPDPTVRLGCLPSRLGHH